MNALAILIGGFFGVAFYVYTYGTCAALVLIVIIALLLGGCEWLRFVPTPIP